jgi:hypothetical protein
LEFDKVFWMGCDCYPVYNIDFAFDDCDEAIFWREVPAGQRFTPSGFGLPESARETSFQVQGDTMVLDLKKCRDAIELTHKFNSDPDHYFQFGFGDQSTFRAAWALKGMTQFSYSKDPVDWKTFPFVYLHQGRDGRTPMIIHRLGSKWPMLFNQAPAYIASMPHERHVWNLFRKYSGSEAFFWHK